MFVDAVVDCRQDSAGLLYVNARRTIRSLRKGKGSLMAK